MNETLHEEAFNDHCFFCGIKLTKDNTCPWEAFSKLNNEIVLVKQCFTCEQKKQGNMLKEEVLSE